MLDVFSIIHVNENVCPFFFPIIVSNQSSTSTAGDNPSLSISLCKKMNDVRQCSNVQNIGPFSKVLKMILWLTRKKEGYCKNCFVFLGQNNRDM